MDGHTIAKMVRVASRCGFQITALNIFSFLTRNYFNGLRGGLKIALSLSLPLPMS
jgi:hypothetical protein